MLNGFFSMWSHDLLIELSETLLVVSVFGASEKFEIEPYIAIKNDGKHKVVEHIGREAKGLASHDVDGSNPFSHPRLLIANFEKAEKVLQFAVAQTSAAAPIMRSFMRFLPTDFDMAQINSNPLR